MNHGGTEPRWFIDVNPTVIHSAAMARDDPQMKLRLPEALRDRIRSSAEENGRSMNAEIVGALSRSYPRTAGAIETARDLFGYFIHYHGKFKDDDAVVIEEMFNELFDGINKLQSEQPARNRDGSEEEG